MARPEKRSSILRAKQTRKGTLNYRKFEFTAIRVIGGELRRSRRASVNERKRAWMPIHPVRPGPTGIRVFIQRVEARTRFARSSRTERPSSATFPVPGARKMPNTKNDKLFRLLGVARGWNPASKPNQSALERPREEDHRRATMPLRQKNPISTYDITLRFG